MNWQAKWIKPKVDMGEIVPLFRTEFRLDMEIAGAFLSVTALGVYEARLNGRRVSEYVLAPGWTSYRNRLQYQVYDVAELLLSGENQLQIYVGPGWYRSRMQGEVQGELRKAPAGLLAQLEIIFANGGRMTIATDEDWMAAESEIRFSDIYDGEVCDARVLPVWDREVEVFAGPEGAFRSGGRKDSESRGLQTGTLIPQEGEEIKKQETVLPAEIFTTPKGETVIDFGQEITGYVEVTVEAGRGDAVDLSPAEMLDKDGNFYNENYRSAKAVYRYICREGHQTYHPKLTFFGFRYIRINKFPGGRDHAALGNFRAIAVYSDMKRTGYLRCSSHKLNRLFDNVVWGQKSNFLDVPTDCPQRDERLGWTGDAQVFVRAACLNFDAEKFYRKWLADLAADQRADGGVGRVVPDLFQKPQPSAAWGDAAVICPWTVYQAYGDKEILRNQFPSMKKWVDYITSHTQERYLWIGGNHYGDWLGLDAPAGSYKGSSRDDLIASAYYAYSTELLIKAGEALGQNMSKYRNLYENIVTAFRKRFPSFRTQTECALAVHFRLAEDCQSVADRLACLIEDAGTKLQTGFVGTPYLLHALSGYGHANLAYSLLLRETYPSWLYPVTKGATTIWEHWDGIMENGEFWSSDMNSFNHYAYGAVADWVYCVAAGIQTIEGYPGYEKVRIAPEPDSRLDWLGASLDTRNGRISSRWTKEGTRWRYEIETCVDAEIVIDGEMREMKAGRYLFYGRMREIMGHFR